MKRGLILLLVFGFAQGSILEGQELIQIINRPTAYALPQGVWEVKGDLNFLTFTVSNIDLSYGLSETLQLGTDLTDDFTGYPNISAKRVLGGIDGVVFATIGSLSYSLRAGTLYSGIGGALSTNLGKVGLHGGTYLGITPSLSLSPYLAFNWDITPNLGILGEMSLLTLQTRLGVFFRTFPNLAVRIWTRFPSFSVWARVSFRF